MQRTSLGNGSRLRALCGAAVLAGLSALCATAAHAHGLEAGRLDLRLIDRTAYLQATPPAAVFRAFDDNGDGRIDVAEANAHRAAMLDRWLAEMEVVADDGTPGQLVLSDLGVPHSHGHDRRAGVGHVRITLRLRWAQAPRGLTVRYRLGERAPLLISARRRASDGTTVRQAARFDGSLSSYTLFTAFSKTDAIDEVSMSTPHERYPLTSGTGDGDLGAATAQLASAVPWRGSSVTQSLLYVTGAFLVLKIILLGKQLL